VFPKQSSHCLPGSGKFLPEKSGKPWIVSGSNKVLPDEVVEMANAVQQAHYNWTVFVAQIEATSSL
jgi:hypothetical protein